jgi:hypothetical protein
MSLVNTDAEIASVRRVLGDAGGMRAITRINELRISESINTIFPKYIQIYSVSGVWLSTDPNHGSTNYYSGDGAKFNAYTGMITLDPTLPGANVDVLINYTYFKGISDAVADDQVTDAKRYIEFRTDTEWDWTKTTDREIQIAMTGVKLRAAQACLIYQYAPDILQMGFNFSIEEFRVESKTWAGSMGIRDLLDLWNKHVDEQIAQLGEYWHYQAPSTAGSQYGRKHFGYKMDSEGNVK